MKVMRHGCATSRQAMSVVARRKARRANAECRRGQRQQRIPKGLQGARLKDGPCTRLIMRYSRLCYSIIESSAASPRVAPPRKDTKSRKGES